MMALFLMLVFFVSATIPVHGQQGFVNIDCGYSGDSYLDKTTGLTYISDDTYIDTGKNYTVLGQYTHYAPIQTKHLRSFPDGDRNCYTLNNIIQGAKYLIRASFLYGNYDGQDTTGPASGYISFDIYLGVNLWTTVNITLDSTRYEAEIVTVASANYFSVCLVNMKLGVPFISALELRPIENNNVFNDVNQTVSLVLSERYNLGAPAGEIVRFPDDKYDRTWRPCSSDDYCGNVPMNTTSRIQQNEGDPYDVPEKIMQTARSTSGNTLSYLLDALNNGHVRPIYYIYLHFAELLSLNSTQSRLFQVSLIGQPNGDIYSPKYLLATHVRLTYTVQTDDETIYFNLTRSSGSTLRPMLNSAEIYTSIELPDSATNPEDAAALEIIKKLYQIKKWQGDPCVPAIYTWIGIHCTFTASKPPRVTSLNLTSYGLTGEIPAALEKLTAIQILDLSNNSLTGPIPTFLANMPSLQFLNLSWNKLSGPIPDALLARNMSGNLILGLEHNDHLCYPGDPCGSKKKKLWIILVASIVSGVVILVFIVSLVICLRRRARRQQPPTSDLPRGSTDAMTPGGYKYSSPSEIRRFSYLEVKAITNNFERVIGRGGFGIVYHGVLEDDTTEVAVKLRSHASSQGTREFNAEANLLSKVEHRNLLSLIGYCEEGRHLALVYPYMAKGSLKDHLFDTDDDRNRVLRWAQRLQIATDAAQGLQYLHTGCTVPIIHRDVKTHNILLTENFEAKLADFGSSKPFPTDVDHSFITASRVVGTDGFLDPEYSGTGQLNETTDVYSFGVVLLELITGVQAVERRGRGHIVEWVGKELDKHEIADVVDAKLRGEYEPRSMQNVLKLAMRCAMKSPSERPTMREVVVQLKMNLKLEVGRGIDRNISMAVSEMSQSDSSEMVQLQMGGMSSPTTR